MEILGQMIASEWVLMGKAWPCSNMLIAEHLQLTERLKQNTANDDDDVIGHHGLGL